MVTFRNTLICPHCEAEMNWFELELDTIVEDGTTENVKWKCVECEKDIKIELCYDCTFYWHK
jgi:hypothetical protein